MPRVTTVLMRSSTWVCKSQNTARAYGIEYSGGAPTALGDLQRTQFPQKRRSRVESGVLAQIRTSNCTEGHSP